MRDRCGLVVTAKRAGSVVTATRAGIEADVKLVAYSGFVVGQPIGLADFASRVPIRHRVVGSGRPAA